jgi:NADPH:quinone reductase-like Zn-dependent oxidoreductase
MTRVVRFHRTGGPEVLQIEDLEIGDPGPGEVRVRVEAIGLNRAEALFRAGNYLEPPRLPARLGYEASALVDSWGEGVTGFQIGQHVNVIPAFSMNNYGVYAEETNAAPHAGCYAAADPSFELSLFSSLSKNNQPTPSEDFGFCPVTSLPSTTTKGCQSPPLV